MACWCGRCRCRSRSMWPWCAHWGGPSTLCGPGWRVRWGGPQRCCGSGWWPALEPCGALLLAWWRWSRVAVAARSMRIRSGRVLWATDVKKTRSGVPQRVLFRPKRLGSVQLLGQLHAAHALVVALDGGGLLALALGGRLFVELAGAQLGQQTQLFDGALEATQSDVERLVFLDADGGH